MIEMLTKEMLKDFYARNYMYPQTKTWACPFWDLHTGVHHHECCKLLFPGWGKKAEITEENMLTTGCPCYKMSTKYVVRKTREFAKKNK